MKKLTSIALHETETGKRMAITFSIYNDDGKAIEKNRKIDRVITDEVTLGQIDAISTVAQEFIEQED